MKEKKRRSSDQEFDLSIDQYALDTEWLEQPERFRKTSRWAADAKLELDNAENNLEVVKSEAMLLIRNDPDDYGITKATEAAISSCVVVQPEVVEAVKQRNQARHKLEVLKGAVQAMEHRKTALSKLVDLHLSNYNSSPRASSHSREEMDELEKKMTRRKASRRLNLDDED